MTAARLAALPETDRIQVTRLFAGLKSARTLSNYVRLLRQASLDPLGVSRGPSRFSSLPSATGRRRGFGVIYVAKDLATASFEVVIRDRFDMDAARVLVPADYGGCIAANVSSLQPLTLLDLTDGNAVRYGVPTDVIRYSVHTHGQHFSEFVYRNMPDVDGLLYRSRLTEILCVAIYERARAKLTISQQPRPLTSGMLSQALASWNVAVR